jgi:hypothetical protein
VSAPAGGNQNHGYQGLGYYGDTSQGAQPPGDGPQRTTLMLAAVLAAVVVIGVAVAVLVVDTKQETPGEALPGAQSLLSSTPPALKTSGKSSSTNDPPQPQATGAPQVPGWKPIAINNGAGLRTTKAYDVPPTWQPLTTTAGFGTGDTQTALFIPAIYMKGYCPTSPTSFRSMSGLMLVPNTGDGPQQASAAAQRFSDAVYTTADGVKPTVDLGQPTPVTVAQDKEGVTITAKVAIAPSTNEKDKCNAPNAVVAMMVLGSQPEDKTSVVLAAFADQGFPEATPEQDLRQIVTSIHAAN